MESEKTACGFWKLSSLNGFCVSSLKHSSWETWKIFNQLCVITTWGVDGKWTCFLWVVWTQSTQKHWTTHGWCCSNCRFYFHVFVYLLPWTQRVYCRGQIKSGAAHNTKLRSNCQTRQCWSRESRFCYRIASFNRIDSPVLWKDHLFRSEVFLKVVVC